MLVGVLNSSIDQSLDIRPDYFCCASSEYCSKHTESSYSSSVGSIATLTGDMDEDNGLDSPVYEERVEERRHDRVELVGRSPTSAEGRGRVTSLYPGLFPAATYVAVQSDCSVVKC